MADYVRFEIYIPVVYSIVEQHRRRVLPVPHELLRDFVKEACDQYNGITQANPLAPALYKGWWKSSSDARIETDYITYLFGLVRIDQADEAIDFFTKWKNSFEVAANQEIILLIYYPVHTIGDFL